MGFQNEQAGQPGGGFFAPRGSGLGGDLPAAPGGTVERAGGSTMFNPNTVATQNVGDQASIFLQALFQNPGMFAQGLGAMASPLQQQAVGNLGSFLGMPAPETRALDQAQPALQGLLAGKPMQSPFGGFSAGMQTVKAAQPVFNQNLQAALTSVANRAPSVRNSAFGDQSSGLAQRALSDFNLFQQQALQQGQQLDLQHALGAGQLAQQGQLGGLSALGMLSQAAGQNPFGRQLAAGQFGAGLTEQTINPILQLMLGGMQFGKQSPLELAIPQDGGGTNWLQTGMQAAQTAAMIAAAAGSSADFKTDITPLSAEDDDAALARLEETKLYRYRYRDAPIQRTGLILEDPTTPEELKYGRTIDLYSYVAELASAVRALARKVER